VRVLRTYVQGGTAEIWRAFASASLTGTVTVAMNRTVPASSVTVVSFAGVATTGTNGSGAIGATASANSVAGSPTASLVTTRANSWVFGVGDDPDNAVARTIGPNQTMLHEFPALNGSSFWVQRMDSKTPVAGTTVTINDTAPATDHYNLSIVEVRTP
jgi:hypothetical protein